MITLQYIESMERILIGWEKDTFNVATDNLKELIRLARLGLERETEYKKLCEAIKTERIFGGDGTEQMDIEK